MTPAMAYLSQQLAGASPARRVAMLYDRAIGALRDAVQAIEAGDIQRRWNANRQAGEIIEALWVTLDMERGGEIAANLDRLYGFMLNHLMGVDLRNDPKPAQDVIDLLEPLRRSWHELAAREDGAGAPTPPEGQPAADGNRTSDQGPATSGAPTTKITLSA